MAAESDTVRLLACWAAVGFAVTAALPPAYHLSALCGRVPMSDLPALLATGLVAPSPSALMFGWTAMTLAMMPLLVVGPVAHVRRCSLRRRKLRATLLFGLAYGFCWVVAGASLAPLALVPRLVLETWAAAGLMLATAVIWSASPMAQAARNACHRHLRIACFGVIADRDCLQQGLETGAACVATCWPWMLLPTLAGEHHLAAMTAVTMVLVADRTGPTTRPRWQMPPAMRLLIGNIGLATRGRTA